MKIYRCYCAQSFNPIQKKNSSLIEILKRDYTCPKVFRISKFESIQKE